MAFAEYMYKKLPKITTFEKHCLIKYEPGTELVRCLESRPDTELHKHAKDRSRRHIDTLNDLALKHRYENHDSGGGPWFDFCLETASDACLWDCLNGWVCADD